MNRIYLCGACNVGKSAIARESVELCPETLVARIDVSETAFGPVFGAGLGTTLRWRKWVGQAPKVYQAVMEYIDLLGEKPEPGKSLVYNEGPAQLLAHLIYFGCLHDLRPVWRVEVIERSPGLLDVGTHVLVYGWGHDDPLNAATVPFQHALLAGRENAVLLGQARGYRETVTDGVAAVRDAATDRKRVQ